MSGKVALKVIKGDMAGREFVFEDTMDCLAGRSDECGIMLPSDGATSRLHCVLHINPPSISARDFGSLNGTFVNGKNIGQREEQPAGAPAKGRSPAHELKHGDELKIGQSVLKVRIWYASPCSVCGKDLLREGTPDARSTCGECQGFTARPSPQPLKPRAMCFVCGKMADGAVTASAGDYVCKECRSDPSKVIRRFFEATDGLCSGARLKDYKIIKEIGEGGMGAVYLVKDERTGELAALKVMLPMVAVNDQSRRTFLREIENMKALSHPNIVRMRDSGYASGIFYMVLDYCFGGGLDKLMRKEGRPMNPSEALRLLDPVLDGLVYAHSAEVPGVKLVDGSFGTGRGLVHRDLKPSNVFLSRPGPDGVVKVADFGLAKSFDFAGMSGHTVMGDTAGTPFYMPRHQALDYRYAKPDVDVWAAAAILYEMLTWKRPRRFPGDSDPWKVLLETHPTPIGTYRPDLPKPLAKVIDTALDDRGTLNFQSASEFKQALKDAL